MCYSLIDSVENVSIFLGGGGGGEVPIHFLKLRFTLLRKVSIISSIKRALIQCGVTENKYCIRLC